MRRVVQTSSSVTTPSAFRCNGCVTKIMIVEMVATKTLATTVVSIQVLVWLIYAPVPLSTVIML